jgi:hypothetical protein
MASDGIRHLCRNCFFQQFESLSDWSSRVVGELRLRQKTRQSENCRAETDQGIHLNAFSYFSSLLSVQSELRHLNSAQNNNWELRLNDQILWNP